MAYENFGAVCGGTIEMDSNNDADTENLDFNIDVIQDSMAAIGISFNEFDTRSIRTYDLWQMPPHLQTIINLGRVFVVHADQERHAMLAVNGGKLCVYSFKKVEPPKRAYIVEYNEVMKLIDPSSRLAFLDLSINTTSIGRLYIRLAPNTEAAVQFSLLCLAELGHSYANTKILQVWKRNTEKEYIQCGDYELNNGTGGCALVPGVSNSGTYNRPWLVGTVWGFLNVNSIAGQFFILTKDNPNDVLTAASFGMVEDSFHVLDEVLIHDVQDVFVKDCGMMLPSSLSQ